MLEAHAFGNLFSSLFVDKLGKEFVGEGKCCCRTFTCSDIAVNGDEVASVSSIFKCLLETRIAGGLFPVENA